MRREQYQCVSSYPFLLVRPVSLVFIYSSVYTCSVHLCPRIQYISIWLFFLLSTDLRSIPLTLLLRLLLCHTSPSPQGVHAQTVDFRVGRCVRRHPRGDERHVLRTADDWCLLAGRAGVWPCLCCARRLFRSLIISWIISCRHHEIVFYVVHDCEYASCG